MVKKVGKEIRAQVPDAHVWEDFLKYIKKIHGKTYGHIGNEVQNALLYYIESFQKGNMDEIKDELLKWQNKSFKQEKLNEIQQKKINTLNESNNEFIQQINVLKAENAVFQGIKNQYDQLNNEYMGLRNQHDKLRNKHDHLQERFNKSQKELNLLEKETRVLHVAVAKVQKMSLFERLLNRLPQEVKQLNKG
jgi:chromosome segregation ATPase